MSVLTRARLIAQQRFDLEDVNVDQNASQTDAKFWTKQFLSGENHIFKGFKVTGLGLKSATVLMAESTLIHPENTFSFSWFTAENAPTNIIVPDASLIDGVRNYLELRLVETSTTPITRAFWDPAANGGAGGEFNQEINTITDLSVEVVASIGGFSGSADRLKLAIIDVDGTGNITGILDKRDLFFKVKSDFTWVSQEEPETVMTLTGVTGTFVVGETLTFTGGATAIVAVGGTTTIEARIFSNDSFAVGNTITGGTSGATGTLATFLEKFTGADKDIDDIREGYRALATEIKGLKGTDFWYQVANGSINGVASYLNSQIASEVKGAQYRWNGTALSIGERVQPEITNLITRADVAGDLNQKYFILNDQNGSVGIWIDVNNSGSTIPAGAAAAARAIEITTIVTGDSAITVATKVAAAVGADAQFSTATDDDEMAIVDAFNGPRTAATDGDSGFAISRTQEGLGALIPGTADIIAKLRLFGQNRELDFTRQDGTGTSVVIPIADKEVLFVKIPSNSTTNRVYSGIGAGVTNYQVAPSSSFVVNDENFWIAYRENNEIYIRDLGQLLAGGETNVGGEVSADTLTYMGATSSTDASPAYPSSKVVTQGASLTQTIGELDTESDVTTKIVNQNQSMSLLDEGATWNWTLSSGALAWDASLFVRVPGLANNVNEIPTAAITLNADGQTASVVVKRVAGASTLVVAVTDIAAVPLVNTIIAQRIGTEIIINSKGYALIDGGKWRIREKLNIEGTTAVLDTTTSTTKDTGALVVEGGVGIEENLNVGGNAIITGNLTVNGTTTTVNSQTLDVADANITVNKLGTQAAANAADAGIKVEMTDATDAQVHYDSAVTSKWKVGDVGAEQEIVTVGHAQVLSNKTLTAGVLQGATQLNDPLEEEITTDAATTGANATIATLPSPFLRLTNGSLISLGALAAPVSGKVITIANITGNVIQVENNNGATATQGILTGTGGNIQLQPDASLVLKYDDTTARWRIIGGTGSGSGGGGLDVFFTDSFEITSSTSATKGQNAAYLTAGVFGGVLSDETVTPISKDQSIKYVAGVSSTNDWFDFGSITLDDKQKGIDVGVTFWVDASNFSVDFEFVVWDITAGKKLTSALAAPEGDVIVGGTARTRYSTSVFIPATTNAISFGFHMVNAPVNTESFLFDDLEFSTNPFVFKNLIDTHAIHIEQVQNAMTNITGEAEFNLATATIEESGPTLIDRVDDSANTRTKFVALRNRTAVTVTVNSAILTLGNVLQIYKNGVVKINSSTIDTTGFGAAVAYTTMLDIGDFITFGGSAGLVNGTDLTRFQMTAIAETEHVITPAKSTLTDWESYVPGTQGLGTIANVQTNWKQIGNEMIIQGRIDTGTPTAVEARLNLPTGFTIGGSNIGVNVFKVGNVSATGGSNQEINMVASIGNNYLTMTLDATATTNQTGSALFGINNALLFFIRVPIAEFKSEVTFLAAVPVQKVAYIHPGVLPLNMNSIPASTAYKTQILTETSGDDDMFSINANQLSLPAGKYVFEVPVSPQGNIGVMDLRIFDTVAAATHLERTQVAFSFVTDNTGFPSTAKFTIEITDAKTFEFQTRTDGTAGNEYMATITVTKLR